MAKIKKTSLIPQNWLVRVFVKDPNRLFSIHPEINYMRLVKATNANAAVRAAAAYCTKKMKDYPGTTFSYSTTEVEPFYYPIRAAFTKEKDDGIIRTKI
jgi:hypothetical protein